MSVPQSAPRISFEFFPPKTLEASFKLWETAKALAPLNPSFVSVTYGAGGTTRDLTHDAVIALGKEFGLNVAAHLTCVDATRDDTLSITDRYKAAGVRELVALRGDPPKGSTGFSPHPRGFRDSVELIEALKSEGGFTLRVGAYPEPHPEAKATGDDVRWLLRKFEAGADSAITQFFFEAETFLRFRDDCEKAGIDGAKIIPGLLPVQSWTGARKFAQSCNAHIPAGWDEAYEAAKAEGREQALSVELGVKLCEDLLREGVQDLHFYTLNRPVLTLEISRALGITVGESLTSAA